MPQEAITSTTNTARQVNDDDNKPNDDPRAEGETWSDDEIDSMTKLMDGLHRLSGGELDCDREAEHNESRAHELSARADIVESEFDCTGTVESIEEAVELRSQALALTPEGHVNRAERLGVLGVSLQLRFERLGEPEDVNKAIGYLTQAVLLTPDDHAQKPRRLNSLAGSYARRFGSLGDLEDVNKAIEYLNHVVLLTPEGDVNRSAGLNNLGNSYEWRFERLGEVADVDKAIECKSQAVLLTPDDHANKPNRLSDLGNAYRLRFERLREVPDVDKAIECQTKAVLLIPDGHKYKPIGLHFLGISYQIRFMRLGEVVDVDKAVECQSQAVLLTPDDHAHKPARLTALGNSHLRRFERLDEVADVDKAIECQTQAVLLCPNGQAVKPALLSNLGNSHQRRFERLGNIVDVDKAIECQTQAVLLIPNGHADKPALLSNLGMSYKVRFERQGEVSDVDKAIECHTQAVLLTPNDHANKPPLLENLGIAYMDRFRRLRQPTDLKSALSSFQSAAQHAEAYPSRQILCARQWADISSLLGISPLQAYERCMELIPRVIWLGTTITQRYELLITISDLAAEAAAWAISVQEYDRALEWLEQGRSVVWSQILQLRTPVDALAAVDPALAEYLASIAAQLEGAGTRPTETSSTSNTISLHEQDAQSHRRLADEWEKALAKARNIPGFGSFMQPRKAEELRRSATDGPIVLVNTHSTRTDALIIFPECDDILHISLAELPLDKAAGLREELYYSTRHRGESDRGFSRVKPARKPEDPLKRTLVDLWSAIVKPVLDALGYTRQVSADELPHVTWCATDVLAFLPLHAAGPYDGSSPNACDLVVSSYTPTLSALLASNSTTPISDLKVLGVGQQDARGLPPLPFTVRELAAVEEQAKSIRYHQLDGHKATVNAVLDAMDEHNWVHLACHASQNSENPAHSVFHLHEGSLTLETITQRQFRNKGLAFLSACETATGDEKLPDEAVHLAAGMMMAGYPSVIATMWPMFDGDGPEVAGRVYEELLKDGKMDHKGAARALHKAVAGLRETIGADLFKRWVPFIHIGV